jgi:hypothetical protein
VDRQRLASGTRLIEVSLSNTKKKRMKMKQKTKIEYNSQPALPSFALTLPLIDDYDYDDDDA